MRGSAILTPLEPHRAADLGHQVGAHPSAGVVVGSREGAAGDTQGGDEVEVAGEDGDVRTAGQLRPATRGTEHPRPARCTVATGRVVRSRGNT